ncbi:hypothetical protein V6N12_007791 [Hibiscus sabdariffa]|uniref:Uncharacterized protein n=1 Tax=Hibiscus sabdariffa TaxID=183260 RepID=A0ABR2F2S7_9ROSI
MAENGACICMHGDHGASYPYSTREGRKTRRLSTQDLDLDLHSDMDIYYKPRGWMHVDVVVGEAACLVLLVNVFANNVDGGQMHVDSHYRKVVPIPLDFAKMKYRPTSPCIVPFHRLQNTTCTWTCSHYMHFSICIFLHPLLSSSSWNANGFSKTN